MKKPFRYTIIHCILVKLHMQAWRSIPQLLLKRLVMNKRRPIWVISCVTRICIWKRKKETSQGLRKKMQSKMMFEDHIDRLSIYVRLNNNYDKVCGIIFSRDFTFQISSFNTIRAKTGEITCSSLIWRGFRLISCCWRRRRIYSESHLHLLKCLLIICGFVNSIAKAM